MGGWVYGWLAGGLAGWLSLRDTIIIMILRDKLEDVEEDEGAFKKHPSTKAVEEDVDEGTY